MELAAFALALAFPILLAVAAAGDLARYRIPNTLCLALALIYPPAALLAGSEPETMLWHLGAGLAVLVAGAALFFARAFGGGDAKLLAAAACWTGFQALPAFLVYVALAGGALALALMALRLVLRRSACADAPWARRLLARPRDVPYGLAIAMGGVAVFPQIDIITSLLKTG